MNIRFIVENIGTDTVGWIKSEKKVYKLAEFMKNVKEKFDVEIKDYALSNCHPVAGCQIQWIIPRNS